MYKPHSYFTRWREAIWWFSAVAGDYWALTVHPGLCLLSSRDGCNYLSQLFYFWIMELRWVDLKFELYRVHELALDCTAKCGYYMNKKSNPLACTSHVLHCKTDLFQMTLTGRKKKQIFCLVFHLVTHFMKTKDLKLWVCWLGNDHVPSLESRIYENEHIYSLIPQPTQTDD